MRTMKLKLLFVCAAVLLLNVTPVAFGLVVGFNPDIHVDIPGTGVVANDFHVQGRLESGNWGGNWSNPPVLISHIDGGFPTFKYSITNDTSDPCGQNWYNFTADWSGKDYHYCEVIHLGLFFDVTCNNVAVNLVGWWTKNGQPIVPPPVNGGAVPIPGFNVRDLSRPGMPQMISLFNQSGGGGGGGSKIDTEIVQMDVVSLTKEELETYLGPIPAAFKELCVSGKQAELPWVQVENERGLISESNPQPLKPDSFFDVFLDVSGPIHPMTPVPIPLGGFLVARERVRFTNNAGQPEIRWDWMIHGAHESDLGDAPDSTNSFGMMPPLVLMTAYPKGGPMNIQANYPTVYQIGSPPFGPIHWAAPLIAFLGPMVSSETEADIGPDMDPTNNIIPLKDTPDLDNFDDGVQVPLVLPNCQWTTFDYLVTIMPPMPAPMPQTPTLYVNVWFDWNRDGDWDDTMQCAGDDVLIPAPEWAVQNQVIAGLPVGLNKITTPPFMPWHPATGDMQPIWMRITLSEQRWAPTAGVLGNGGCGPQYGYIYGETEDYYFVPEVPVPQPKPLVEHSKWSQPPIEWNPQSITPPVYCGWDAPSFKEEWEPPPIWQIVADDFRCLGTMPITSIRWWGSYIGWMDENPPAAKPTAWRIGFWSNVPPSPVGGISHPGKLLWQFEVRADRVKEEWVGSDQFPDVRETCFQYYVNLTPKEYFWQAKQEPNTVDSVFWLSIAAIYPQGPPPPNPWGWKTRPWHWMDDAVTFTIQGDFKPGYVPDPGIFRALEYCGQSYDTAFELDTDPNYIKWEQAYTGLRDWPHYEDEESMATVDTVVEPVTKWSQKPDTGPNGIDVDASDDIWRPQLLADDFPCTMTGPITDFHIWGSWYHDHPPFGNPTAVTFILSIHENLPVGNKSNPYPYSIPGKVLWLKKFAPGEFQAQEYARLKEGWFVPCAEPQYYDSYADNICWRYTFFINPIEAFIQQQGNIYWLDVQAIPTPEPAFPEPIRFGWKDSTTHFMDNAVWATTEEPVLVPGPWHTLIYPLGHPYAGNKIDLAFAITTNMMYKYTQEPDLQTPFSIDIDATKDQIWNPQVLADDFKCITKEPVTDIHIWGSWWHDTMLYGPNNVEFTLSIHADIPAGPVNPYSMPGTILWQRVFHPGEFKGSIYAEQLREGYFVPCAEPQYYEPGGDTVCVQYDFYINDSEAFVQQGSTTDPKVYWLSVQARPSTPAGVPAPPMRRRFGWKTTARQYHWNDDAVWSKNGGTTWNELHYPPGHPYAGQTADLAFSITTQKQYEQFNLRRQVADDWKCERQTPVTAAVWWGSYIGYGYEACQCQTTTPRPTKPDYFLLSIWTDVPANPGDPSSFSHPGVKKWEYKANKYDEVLVGYDKHPEPGEPGTGGYEPVFRYSVKLPQTSWFRQKDVNEVFWFSVVAVYDQNDPTYPWGWTNHKHVFNDDAVAGYQGVTGGWIWEELYDQTGRSTDMSFILFTEPGCFPSCHKDYFTWLSMGKPDCWCYLRQCYGDSDNAYETTKTGKFYVHFNDLNLLLANWNVKGTTMPVPGICADFARDTEITKTGTYRVHFNDLNILLANWNVKEPPGGPGMPTDCLKCP